MTHADRDHVSWRCTFWTTFLIGLVVVMALGIVAQVLLLASTDGRFAG